MKRSGKMRCTFIVACVVGGNAESKVASLKGRLDPCRRHDRWLVLPGDIASSLHKMFVCPIESFAAIFQTPLANCILVDAWQAPAIQDGPC